MCTNDNFILLFSINISIERMLLWTATSTPLPPQGDIILF